jgi:hypothetical protein
MFTSGSCAALLTCIREALWALEHGSESEVFFGLLLGLLLSQFRDSMIFLVLLYVLPIRVMVYTANLPKERTVWKHL